MGSESEVMEKIVFEDLRDVSIILSRIKCYRFNFREKHLKRQGLKRH